MSKDVLKPPTVPRCPKCGFASAGGESCEACGANLPVVRPHLVSGPTIAGAPPLKREATGGWLAPVLFVLSIVVLLLGGLWYYFAPQIAAARHQAKLAAAESRKRQIIASKAAPQPAGTSVIIEDVPAETTPAKAESLAPTPAPTEEAAPTATPAPAPTATPNPEAMRAGAEVLQSVLGGVFGGSGGEEQASSGTEKPSSRSTAAVEKPPSRSTASVSTPAIDVEPTPTPRRKLSAASASAKPQSSSTSGERPIVLTHEAFSSGRESAPPPNRQGTSTRKLAAASNFFVSPPKGQAAAPAAVSAVSGVMPLTETTFSNYVNQGTYPVVVDFWAAWCGPCRRFAPEMEKAAAEMGQTVRFAKVDVEASKDLARRYNITSLPTVVLFKGGVERQRTEGAMDAASLKAWVNAAR